MMLEIQYIVVLLAWSRARTSRPISACPLAARGCFKQQTPPPIVRMVPDGVELLPEAHRKRTHLSPLAGSQYGEEA